MKIFFDGGCRPNPGAIETAVVARGTLYHQRLGHGSSDTAEWLALLHALAVARMLGESDVKLVGDSASVIGQASGIMKCRSAALAQCLARFQAEARHFARLRVRHVPRTQNLAGIALARMRQGIAFPAGTGVDAGAPEGSWRDPAPVRPAQEER